VLTVQQNFQTKLAEYKALIDADIEQSAQAYSASTLERYGEHAETVSKAYSKILKRGGKRIRGALTLVGYEMCGGKDQAIALQAARAIEMMHAYMLVIDDIQDRADLRRGGPSAHRLLEAESRSRKWGGDPAHTGVSLALNAALIGSHGAEMLLANLDIDPELKIKALMIMNHTILVTVHGQTHDIINQVEGKATLEDIENVMQWKTAHYTFLNPIHMGMVLAGAGCEDTNGITDYAINAGKAFQISDDLLVVSDGEESGKLAIDDIREGKQTLLTVHALKHASKQDAEHLKKCLGNQDLTDADFRRCQKIFASSGAVEYARGAAGQYVEAALESLHQHAGRWDDPSVAFLEELAKYVAAGSK
jgi:geranylgeranyl diphosphate synthase type I